jgi:hypothetical protein
MWRFSSLEVYCTTLAKSLNTNIKQVDELSGIVIKDNKVTIL